jgi:hypothetical protein
VSIRSHVDSSTFDSESAAANQSPGVAREIISGQERGQSQLSENKDVTCTQFQTIFEYILICLVCGALVSCQDSYPGWKPLQISTDKEAYGSADTVVVTLFNPSNATAHVITWCSRLRYDVILADSDHFYAGYPPSDCGEVSNLPIGAGTSIKDSLCLPLIGVQEGTFYLCVSYWLDIGELRNPGINCSNDFAVRSNH